MIAPQQPKKPTIRINTPAVMHSAVALRKLKLGESEAKEPLET